MPSVFESAEYFGQLRSILAIELPPGITPLIVEPKTLILAIIGTRDTTTETSLKNPYYTKPKSATVSAVDMTTLMCLVGCIKDWGQWAIVDRSGDSTRAEFID